MGWNVLVSGLSGGWSGMGVMSKLGGGGKKEVKKTAVVTKFYVKPSTILTHYDAKIMVSHVATDQL